MNWIKIEEIDNYQLPKNILVWQNNLSDKECSRFQRATYFDGIIKIYPSIGKSYFLKKDNYKNYDLEGDMCQITHFAIVNEPIF